MANRPNHPLELEAAEALSAVLSGNRPDVAAVAAELGLTSLELARALVSYALSPSYAADLDTTLQRFCVSRDDFHIATLLASAEWEDHSGIVERVHQVYGAWPSVRTDLAQISCLLVNYNDMQVLSDFNRNNVLADLIALIPLGFRNTVLGEILKQPGSAESPHSARSAVAKHGPRETLLYRFEGMSQKHYMIEVMGLVKKHGEIHILKGIDLTVPRGEVAAIIGPSGSGKSTFMRCLCGLEPFQEGSITIDNNLLLEAAMSESARIAASRQLGRRVGIVFESFNLFPHRTVLQQVTEGPIFLLGRPREHAEAAARNLLDRVGLGDKMHVLPGELSGGEQQRVAIARAISMDKEVILFDEPTGALDPSMSNEVLVVMADLARHGMTMVVVTHSMRFARQVAHTIHVIDDGLIVESGPPDQIFDAPRANATKQYRRWMAAG
jgi:ABC-type polar amino acid transport system ATPase subunit